MFRGPWIFFRLFATLCTHAFNSPLKSVVTWIVSFIKIILQKIMDDHGNDGDYDVVVSL